MKKEPCIRFGIRIRPKISENPADSRNKSPPSAMLFTANVSQSDMSDARPHAPPSPSRTRVFPSSANYRWSKSETSDLDVGEGWGGGSFDSADLGTPLPARACQVGCFRL